MGLCEVRHHMLIENRELRGRLNEIEALAISVASGRSALFPFLRVRGLELLEALETQITWEEKFLLPAIRDIYGPERAARAGAEQRAHRELMRFQLEEITDRTRPPLLLAHGLRDLATVVRNELEEEERLFFDPDLLRGDGVFADVETG
ncbi:MAG: hemerythrin domain-containing protein [Candidatus Binatia bacterium]